MVYHIANKQRTSRRCAVTSCATVGDMKRTKSERANLAVLTIMAVIVVCLTLSGLWSSVVDLGRDAPSYPIVLCVHYPIVLLSLSLRCTFVPFPSLARFAYINRDDDIKRDQVRDRERGQRER